MISGQARMETRIMTDAMIVEAIRAAGGAQGAQGFDPSQYQQQGGAQGGQDYYDADYTVVDDDKK